MKRTKQRFDKEDNNPPKFVSGCRQFEGEDVGKFHFFVILCSLFPKNGIKCRALERMDHAVDKRKELT